MESDKVVLWMLRLSWILILLVPLIFYSISSKSLYDLMPKFLSPSLNPKFQITSIKLKNISDKTYFLEIGLFNSGNMVLGLESLEGEIDIPRFNFAGRLSLESLYILPPGEEREMCLLLIVKKGCPEDFQRLITERPVINFSGNTTLILDSIKLPVVFSTKLHGD
ncbi:MAG: hypothetical protein QXT26_00895 [Thermoproteota archaeon]